MSDFPDVRWGSESSRLREPLVAFSITRLGSWLIKTATPLDRKVLLRSRGRFTVLGPIGAPLLLLTSTGARSGQPRTTPLIYARQGESLVVVGSNFGQAHHPAWTGNLLKEPSATVTLAGKDIPVRAELLHGEQAQAAYQLLIDLTRTYDAYRSRTDREIRVFRLTAR
ncbi:MAG: nitroreductase [Frankiales bacterium]|nr:nitroreductase [Frankiales bacterium]